MKREREREQIKHKALRQSVCSWIQFITKY